MNDIFNKEDRVWNIPIAIDLAVIGAALSVALLDIFGADLLTANKYIDILLIVLAIVLARLMISNITTEANNRKISQANSLLANTQNQINELFMATGGNLVAINPDEEPHIWDNFTGTYFAINAPWQVEKYTRQNEKLVEIHSKRYRKNGSISLANYVFFRTSFQDAENNFRGFMKQVTVKTPAAQEKVKVIRIDEEQPPYTIFVGTKRFDLEASSPRSSLDKESEMLYSIIYINSEPFTDERGYPYWAIVSTDATFNQTIMAYAKHLCAKGMSVPLQYYLDE